MGGSEVPVLSSVTWSQVVGEREELSMVGQWQDQGSQSLPTFSLLLWQAPFAEELG